MQYRVKPSLEEIEELAHYGTPRHSGRYPWGSGENPYQRTGTILSRYYEYQNQGLSEVEIAEAMGTTTTKLRPQIAYAKNQSRIWQIDRARSLKEDGLSNADIGKAMGGLNESTIRSLLNENSEARTRAAVTTAKKLKEIVDEKGIVDVGPGVERELGVSRNKLDEALYQLEVDGYLTEKRRLNQVTNPNQKTTLKLLCKPGTEKSDIYDVSKIGAVSDYAVSYDDGETFHKPFEYPSSMDPKRLKIRYAEEGGLEKDGVIELRRGVKDLNLGESNYAQVRIMVGGDRYLKGMAVYSDDMPDGVDVIFNTNKSSNKTWREVLKPIKTKPDGEIDRDNPFGSLIKEHGGQSFYDDPKGDYIDGVTGKKQSLSLINKRADEGDWGEWAKKLPSQFLGKQSIQLIHKQLNLAKADADEELAEINALTNPTIKKVLLKKFADGCDGINSFSFSFLGAWSIETLNESFGGLAECVKQWNGVSIPEGLGADLTDLANGIKSFDDTDSFATNLKTFGENFKKYYDSISAIEPEKMMNATNGLKGIVDVVDLLDGKDVSQLWTMGQAMQDLFSVDDSMYNNLELLYSNMQKTGETMIDRLMLGITNKTPNVTLTAQQTITNIIGDMATQIGTDQTVVIQAFEGMLDAAIEYLNSRKEDFGKYISSACDEMITAMSNRYDDFANAGSYVIAGFVKGMKDAKMDAITAASNIALEAYRAACDALDVHSPSKKFAWIGMQTDKGLAEGMLKYGQVAKEAAKRTASETVNAAQNSIYGIRGMFDGIDLTPIIRPIVDLDAVKNGVAQLNGMTTGMNTGLRLDTAYAYVSSAAASMDAKKANENQNGLEKVANELKALRDNPPVTMNNKFDITNPDPEAVANKAVSKIVRQIGRDTSRG